MRRLGSFRNPPRPQQTTTTTMKCIAAVSTVAALVASTDAMVSFSSKFPNGDILFEQALGHTADMKLTEFGTAFKAAGKEWTKTFCEAKFPGTQITNGAAFGDPCCTWKSGPAPQKVTKWSGKPTEGKECASKGGAGAGASAGASTGAASKAPAAATPAAGGEDDYSDDLAPTPASTPAPATTKAPVAAPTPAAISDNIKLDPVVPVVAPAVIADSALSTTDTTSASLSSSGNSTSTSEKEDCTVEDEEEDY